MAQQLLVYVSVILMGGTLSLFLAVYALLRFRNAPGGRYYVLAALMASLLAYGYAFELTSADLGQIKFWIGIEYFSLPFLPVFTLLMCLEYAGIVPGPWKRRALFAIPAITFVLQHTNDWHHLYYASIGLQPNLDFPIVKLTAGPWYIVHTLFLYGCLALSIAALLLQIRKARHRFRMQMLAMAAGVLVPVAGNLYYLAGLSPYGIDLGPVFISVSFIFHSMAVFRFRMFNVAPIARDIVFESMGDGVLVLNEQQLVVDYNRAMLTFVPELAPRSIGRFAPDVLDGRPEIAACIQAGQESDLLLESGAEAPVYVHVRFSPIRGRAGCRSGSIVTFVDITERIAMEQELKRLASTDGLTGLFNKSTLIERSERVIGRAPANGAGVSVVMFDVDHFKKVNDTLGHEAGDRVLGEVANVIRAVLGEQGIAGRYGGDEFVLCLPDTGPDKAVLCAERIRAGIEMLEIPMEGRLIRVTSSFGASHMRPSSGSDMQILMRRADQALYRAKKLGRNRVALDAADGTAESREAT
ncbi:histidine kinase N-terminal 7TM domain-containing diguanylate cyclase [Saccharibacillus deserti]|uniref:histidine kinase N-terminal 7TM domain-containing diguanylate cyclase n=1 Tax=Saccharibacillus deserti TaxID=1634444 RepID=UPI001556FF60|nr:histidine kinase N-terminal 7TM domain-containing protein [Saccharibacillus deserti]